MTDIVWLLRNDVPCNGDIDCARELCNQAADEIKRLRAALREIVKLDDEWVPETQDDYTYTGYQVCADIARAALEGKHD